MSKKTTVPNQIIVEVTQDDIDKGKQGDCDRCALGRAVRRQFPRRSEFLGVMGVDLTVKGLDGLKGRVRYPGTRESDRFMWAFDKDKKLVKPRKFVFKLHPAYLPKES